MLGWLVGGVDAKEREQGCRLIRRVEVVIAARLQIFPSDKTHIFQNNKHGVRGFKLRVDRMVVSLCGHGMHVAGLFVVTCVLLMSLLNAFLFVVVVCALAVLPVSGWCALS